mmetsp:Transcript_68921/g.121835  ORF Transcript_68921/g.121835 Transcript_68921/m.121835 type:complete len:554 (-) Transcript_68921:37-1698(-)
MTFFNFFAAALLSGALSDESCQDDSEACLESSNFLQISWETENQTISSQPTFGILLQHRKASGLASSLQSEYATTYSICALIVFLAVVLILIFQRNSLNSGPAAELLDQIKKKHVPDTAPGTWRRALIMMISTAFFTHYASRQVLSVAMGEMAAKFGYSSTTEGVFTGVFFAGHMVGQPLFGILTQPDAFSPKHCLIFGVLGWSTCTIMIPSAALQSVNLLILARFALGLFQGAAYPAVYTIMGKWIPMHQKATVSASIAFGQCLGAATVDCTSSIIADNWHTMFYVFGLLGFVWCIPAWICMSNTPATHPFISLEEVHYIDECFKAEGKQSKKDPFSYWEMLQERSFLAVMVGSLCWGFSWSLLLSWMPTYFQDVLGFSTAASGHLAQYGYFLGGFAGLTWGYVFDELVKQDRLEVASARAGAASISMMGASTLFLFIMSNMYSASAALQGSMLAMSVVLLTANKSGTWANILDLGGATNSGKIVALISAIGDVSGMISSFGVGVALDITWLSWSSIFFTMLAFNAVGTLVFVRNMSTQPLDKDVLTKGVDG